MKATDELLDLDARRATEAGRVTERRRAQAAAKRILGTIEFEATLRDLQARLREAERAATRASRRKREAADALVAAAREQLERFERVEGPAMLRAAAAIAEAISPGRGTAADPARASAPEPHESAVAATAEHPKPNGRPPRSQHGYG